MDRSTKEAWLTGPGDLEEADVEDVPVPGMSVRVRGLPAQYSNEASSKALEYRATPQGDQVATINTGTMEVLQFTYGVIDPKFSEPEARIIAQRFGPAFRRVIEKIDELSGVDKEAIKQANTHFQPGGESEAGGDVADESANGSGGQVLPASAGAGVAHAGGGDV